jgi:dTDP-4-dehydrorhamnose reductase
MRVLVLGCKGQLGRCLSDQLNNTDFEIIQTSRAEIDVSDLAATKDKILIINPSVVINATAYTAVDKAEDDQQAADLINHLAVANLASICNQLDCWLVHVSTDYVFDGMSLRPYQEDDQTNPQGVYGDTKLKGERAIQASGCKHLILRTAWVFSEYGNNFLKTMIRLGAERDELSIVGDQIGCPTYAQDIAGSIVAMLPSLESGILTSDVLHYCGDSPVSWFEFAEEIFSEARKLGLKTPSLLHSIETSAYPTPAARPAYSVLDCSKITANFGIDSSDWRQGIRLVLGNLQSQN